MSAAARPVKAAPARARVSRGTLSRQQIVDATLALVRADPETSITMERVAGALGTRPMSLYTHVRNRDELVALAAAQALSEWDASVPRSARWETQLRTWCRSLRDHVLAYRPLLLEMTGQGTFQPALLEEVAVLARVLRRAGLEGAGLAAALRWVPQTVLGAIVARSAPAAGPRRCPRRSRGHPRLAGRARRDRPGPVRRRAAVLHQPGPGRPVRVLDRPSGRRRTGCRGEQVNRPGLARARQRGNDR